MGPGDTVVLKTTDKSQTKIPAFSGLISVSSISATCVPPHTMTEVPFLLWSDTTYSGKIPLWNKVSGLLEFCALLFLVLYPQNLKQYLSDILIMTERVHMIFLTQNFSFANTYYTNMHTDIHQQWYNMGYEWNWLINFKIENTTYRTPNLFMLLCLKAPTVRLLYLSNLLKFNKLGSKFGSQAQFPAYMLGCSQLQ